MPRRTFATLARAAVVFALTCTAAFAQKTINIPADFPTIQGGINAASTGDTVLVAPGTYYENIDFKGKAITVTSSAGAAQTIIDGQGKTGFATVAFLSGETRASVISNMTIRNGGSGGNFFPFGEVSGGVYAYQSAPTILNNVITANTCNGVVNNTSAALIQGNTISATKGATAGYCLLDRGNAILEYGYNLSFGSGIVPTILGNIIENNVEGIYGEAGGVYLWGGDNTVIQGNIFRHNNGTRAGAIASANTNTVSILQNLFYANSGGGAGAINLLPPGESAGSFIGIIAGNTIAGNSVTYGNTYAGDLPASQVYLSGNLAQYLLVNNIIVGNNAGTAAVNCDVGYSYLAYTPLVFDHNDIFPGQGVSYAGSCADQTGTYGNINADPRFVNAAAFDFHLQSSSPAIDTGNNSAPLLLQTDLANSPRLTDATGFGFPVVDMGAYEYAGLKDATPSILGLVPSSYYPFFGFPYGNANTPFTLTAQMSSTKGIPTGSVTFYEDATDVGTLTLDASGSATLQPAVPKPGLHAFTATYPGQGSFPPAVSVKFFILFPKISPSLTLTSSPNPSTLGSAVIFSATITSSDGGSLSPIILTDTTTDTILATLTPNSAGLATYTTSTLAVGYHNITATYAGDSAHNSASASVYQRVLDPNATSITLSSSLNPSIAGQTVTFTSTVTSISGTPTGSIQFTDNGTALGTQALSASGTATLSTNTLTIGTHNITATYIPTGTFAGSSTSISQTVNAITNNVNLTSSLNPSTYGQAITITAHVVSNVGAALTGSVAFYDNNFLATAPIDPAGNAVYTTSSLTVGAHGITAIFTPTGSSTTSSGSYTQNVNGLASSTLLTATPSSGVGLVTPITLTATVAPAVPSGTVLTGSVIFYLNGAQLATVSLVNGTATFTGTFPFGSNQLYANYAGDPNRVYDSSISNTVTVTMSATPTTLTLHSSANPSPALVPVTFTAQLFAGSSLATIVGPPIVFTIDGQIAGTVNTANQGLATFTTSALTTGSHIITASFAGSLIHGPATPVSITQQVTPDATATTITGPSGTLTQVDPVALAVTVRSSYLTAIPSGTITIFEGTLALGTTTLTSTGSAFASTSFNLAPLAAGTHNLVAVYAPNSISFLPSRSIPLTLIIIPASFTLTLSDPTLTVQTGHHRTETVSLTSIGALTGAFTLSCGPRPDYTTCAWSETSVTLPANGTVSTSLIIDTDQLPGFLSSTSVPSPTTKAGAPFIARFLRDGWAGTTFACLLPLTLFTLRRRSKLRSLLSLLLLAALATTITACGANKYPYSTAPGTYVIPITATGPPVPGRISPTQTVNLKLIVTE